MAEVAARPGAAPISFRPSLASGLRNRQLTAGLTLVLAIATMSLLIDLLYPRLDPRISYARR